MIMKKILFCALTIIMLLPAMAYSKDDFEIISEEMLFSGNTEQNLEENQEKSEKVGIFGFVGKFFGLNKNKNTENDHNETFIEKNERMAQDGDIDAQMNLAYIYLYGTNGVKTDYKKSAKYYEMAAAQNNPVALNNLGSLYFNGIGVTKDIRKALNLFEEAAALGNENAAINLAFIYLSGGKKDSVRNKKAISLLQKAQDKSNIAKFMLGYAYYRGFEVPQDYEKAFQLIQAAATGDAQIDEAQLVLARMYRHGYGTVQNYQRAVEFYRSSALQGNMEAIMSLAKVYMRGKICPQNLPMSHALFNIAAARNVPNAAQMRDELVEELHMNLELLTQAQKIAQEYQANPSELTTYIRQTYGTDIRSYIDKNMPQPTPKKAQ